MCQYCLHGEPSGLALGSPLLLRTIRAAAIVHAVPAGSSGGGCNAGSAEARRLRRLLGRVDDHAGGTPRLARAAETGRRMVQAGARKKLVFFDQAGSEPGSGIALTNARHRHIWMSADSAQSFLNPLRCVATSCPSRPKHLRDGSPSTGRRGNPTNGCLPVVAGSRSLPPYGHRSTEGFHLRH